MRHAPDQEPNAFQFLFLIQHFLRTGAGAHFKLEFRIKFGQFLRLLLNLALDPSQSLIHMECFAGSRFLVFQQPGTVRHQFPRQRLFEPAAQVREQSLA